MVDAFMLVLFVIGFLVLLCVCGGLVWLINYSIQRIEINIDDNYIRTTYRTARIGGVLKPLKQRFTWTRIKNWIAEPTTPEQYRAETRFILIVLACVIAFMWGSSL